MKLNNVETLALSSTLLKSKCVEIFGSVVEAVYILGNYEDSLEDIRKYESQLLQNNRVQYDTCSIVVKFTCGNCVQFLASEWASIEKVQIND